MKTIAQVVKEYKNRHNPQFKDIGVMNCDNKFERFNNPSNIIEPKDNNGWLEFDTVYRCTDHPNTTQHIKMYAAGIVEYREIISDVNKNV